MAVQHTQAVQQLSSAARRTESCPSVRGPISLKVKQMGARSAGNPHMHATWRGLETWHGWDAPALPARQPSTLLMSGDGKRSGLLRAQPPCPSSTLLVWSAGGDRPITVRIAHISPSRNAGGGKFGIALSGPVRKRMRLEPQSAGGSRRIDAGSLPPCRFVATTMNLAMMAAAERHSELVAHLAAKRRLLGEAQMMRI